MATQQANVASIYTSPLRRARDTAAAVAGVVGLKPTMDERLVESARGSWEGRLVREIAQQEPELWAAWQRPGRSFRFPGGESLEEHLTRVHAALVDLAVAPQPALVVCHGGTIRCALMAVRGLPVEDFHAIRVPHATLVPLDASWSPGTRRQEK